MLAGGLIISRRFVQVRTSPKHRSTHISNYQSSEHESNQHDESDMVKFSCALKNALLIIRDRFGMSFASKGLGYLAALLLLLLLLARYKLSCYQTNCYRLLQCLQKIPCWKPLVISFCSSLGSTLLLIEKSYNWSPILVGHQARVAARRRFSSRSTASSCRCWSCATSS